MTTPQMRIPKTFKQAVDTYYDRCRYMHPNNPRSLAEFQDFLAQKFTVAYNKTTNEQEFKLLADLWKSILEGDGE